MEDQAASRRAIAGEHNASFTTVHRNLPLSFSAPLDIPACFEDPPRNATVDISNAFVQLQEIPGHLDKNDIETIQQIVSPSRVQQQGESPRTALLQHELGDTNYLREVIIANHPLLPHIQNAMVERHRLDYAHIHSLNVGMRHVDEVLLDALRLLAEDPSFGTLQNTLDTEAKVLIDETTRHGKNEHQEMKPDDQQTTSASATPQRRKRPKPKSSRPSKRGATPACVQQVLKDWLFTHAQCPYPGEEEKAILCQQTGLSMHQLNNWFINARRRILPAYLKSLEKE